MGYGSVIARGALGERFRSTLMLRSFCTKASLCFDLRCAAFSDYNCLNATAVSCRPSPDWGLFKPKVKTRVRMDNQVNQTG